GSAGSAHSASSAGRGPPAGGCGTCWGPRAARDFARQLGGRAVVKADGLAAGKGAVVCRELAAADRAIGDILERRVFGEAGARVVVEELLDGGEGSIFALTDGERVWPPAAAPDHKAGFDRDPGPD